ncbi:MAG: DNA-directed polymerase subunit [Candidatus Methanomethylophilaceae archaeon]|nr:DNA-directed polymerase subunit [Candidatus Methanomethylophilaceae archaeon]
MEEGRYLSLAEVKEILENESELRELTTEQKAALEHASKMAKLSAEDSRKIIEEFLSLDFINPFVATKLADIMPQHPEDVRAIFSKERIVLEKKHINQIIDIVVKYL